MARTHLSDIQRAEVREHPRRFNRETRRAAGVTGRVWTRDFSAGHTIPRYVRRHAPALVAGSQRRARKARARIARILAPFGWTPQRKAA